MVDEQKFFNMNCRTSSNETSHTLSILLARKKQFFYVGRTFNQPFEFMIFLQIKTDILICKFFSSDLSIKKSCFGEKSEKKRNWQTSNKYLPQFFGSKSSIFSNVGQDKNSSNIISKKKRKKKVSFLAVNRGIINEPFCY